ncbi:MAG: hypothetical protein CMI53_02255 [Parcubacteria group bacterium]|nr:hypothetical protein [Parcubacteria group bacterium]
MLVLYARSLLIETHIREDKMMSRELFRVIDPGYGKRNIFRFAAMITVSLGPVVVATIAKWLLPWLDAEVVSENNVSKKRGAPLDDDGLIDHIALQTRNRATVVGISASITNAVPRALRIIETYVGMSDDLRPKGIVVGGWHAGDDPEPFLRAGADVVVHGEGELIIAQLVEALATGKSLEEIPGISYFDGDELKRNLISNPAHRNLSQGQETFLAVPQSEIESMPDPDFGLVRFANIKLVPVSRTRGCTGRCKFCRVKGAARYLSPERLVGQIQNGYSQGKRRFFVVDDRCEEDMIGFIAWLKLLVNWIETNNIKGLDISCQCRLSLAGFKPSRSSGIELTGPEIMALMRRACINTVCIGFESPIKEELDAMSKPTKQSMMLEWAKTWKSFGFLVHAMMIFGYPIRNGRPLPRNAKGEVMTAAERAQAFWSFIKKAAPTYLQVLIYSPIIGTDDRQWLEVDDRILSGIPLELHDGLHVLYQPDAGSTPQEVQHEAINLSRRFYARRIAKFQWLALVCHSLKVASITCSMPFIWAAIMPLHGFRSRDAWQWPKRMKRVAIRHWGAQFIIVKFLKNLHPFERLLARVSHQGNSV